MEMIDSTHVPGERAGGLRSGVASGRRTVLLTGGRAPATLDLARLFHAAGHRVILAESQAHPVTRASRAVERTHRVARPRQETDWFVRDLERILRAEEVDLLVPTCEEAIFVSQALDVLSRHCRVLVDRPEKVLRLHDKYAFNQSLHARGIAAPDSRLVRDRGELVAALAGAQSPVVLKPSFSRFASKVVFVESPRATQVERLPVSIDPENPWLVQQKVSGREHCAYAVADRGALRAFVSYTHDFRAGRGAGICFESRRHDAIFAWVSRFVADEAYTGQLAFDFIESEDGELWPLECNPRATSGVHLFSPDSGLPDAMLGAPFDGCVAAAPDGRRAMIAAAMLLYGLPSVRSVTDLTRFARGFATARDAVLDSADPMPFFYQFVMLGSLAVQARRENVSLLEATTHDIEWNGGGGR